MCVLFHPDKHLDELQKTAAQCIFNKIHTAYSVLSDAQLRPIYDEHGIQGVEAAKQLGDYLDGDLQKLRDELARRRSGLRSRTVVSAGIDASMLLEDWTPIQNELVWSDYVPQVSNVALTHKLEGTLEDGTSYSVAYSAATKNGQGNGIVSGTITRQMSERLYGRLEFAVGSQRRLGWGLSYALSQKMSMDVLLTTDYYGGAIEPGYQVTISRAIVDQLAASLTFSNGNIAAGLGYISETNPASLTCQLADERISLSAKYAQQLDDTNTLKVKLNTAGPVLLGLGLVRSSDSDTKTAFHFEAGPIGVGLKIVHTLRDLSLILPIYISRELSSHSILLGVALPSLVGLVVHNFALEPWRRHCKERYWSDFVATQIHLVEERRNETAMAVTLMEPFYQRKRLQEEPNGLIITSAYYERASPMGSPLQAPNPTNVLDVTIPLQMLVVDSQICLEKGSKSNLLGFYDIAVGHAKLLRIDYCFRGIKHQACIADEAQVLLPLRSHIIPE
ncbi:DnaJ subfamily C member 11 [Paramicrosporidium saccamoebae]|uniref:DnaJ subfamily C member 11 n=1 Tax=Paramicrosporidium saccamoebae TaxID=1246581 RepID=A0A2H9TL80_9FUNG|nr:DnaJ subfamily C member 11 [Paramicrosporidium saccamoebae]